LPDRVSRSGDPRYDAATALWAKTTRPLPQAVVHARNAADVQAAIRAAREGGFNLSVRGGGHDWAGRALCGGLVIDLRGMNQVDLVLTTSVARMGGGARAGDVANAADALGLAVAAGSSGDIGMAGLTMGGGYGALIARCGLVLDNLASAQVVL